MLATSQGGRPHLCGAKLRGGGLCAKPPIAGKRRCRSHGCATGSGAPKGNKNALKHGRATREKRAALPGKGIAKRWRECRARTRKIMRELKKHKGNEPKLSLPSFGRWTYQRMYGHIASLLIKQEAYCRRLDEAGYFGLIDEARGKAGLLRELCDYSELFESQGRFVKTLNLLLTGPVIEPNASFFPGRYREAWYALCHDLIRQSYRLSETEVAFRRERVWHGQTNDAPVRKGAL